MELRQITDRSGNTLSVKYYNGMNFNPHTVGNVKDHLESLQNLSFGSNDVVIWSYPKSGRVYQQTIGIPMGTNCVPALADLFLYTYEAEFSQQLIRQGTHWLFEITSMLLSGSTEYHRGIINTFEFFPMQAIQNLKVPRAICTHLPYKYFPKNFIEKKRKILYLFRNPKDVVVSSFNFYRGFNETLGYRGSWHDYLDLFLTGNVQYGSWFDFVKNVEDFRSSHQDYPILTLCYEDMKKDLLKEVRKISTFLECERDETFLEQVATKCLAENMIPAKKTNVPEELAELSHDGASNIFFRKGDVGDWKNWFTVAEDERFNEMLEKVALETKLNIKFTI